MGETIAMPEYPCAFCRKREATQLCDFVVDYSPATIFSGKGGWMEPPHPDTCNNQMCKECATKYNGHEFCPSCNKLHQYIKKNHDKRPGRLYLDSLLGEERVKVE